MQVSPDKKIKDGLKFVMIGLLLFGISELVSGVATIAGSFAILCVIAIVELIGIIVLFVGVYKLYKSAEYISPSHKTKVIIATVLIIINFLLGFLGGFIMGLDATDDPTAVARNAGVLGAVSAFLYAAALILLVYEISTEEHKKYILGLSITYIIVNLIFLGWLSSISSGSIGVYLNRLGISQIVESLFSFGFAGMFYLIRGNLSYPGRVRKSAPYATMAPPGAPPAAGQQRGPYPERSTSTTPGIQSSSMFCPNCGNEMRYRERDGGWYCDRCQQEYESRQKGGRKYKRTSEQQLYRRKAQEETKPRKAGYEELEGSPEPSWGASNLCPTCGSQMRYIEENDRWYCDNCREYK